MSPELATEPTKRFSNRVDYYIRYRPKYPPTVLEFLCGEPGLTPAAVIADIGSGTGISAEMFLQYGNQVYGVEPNVEMRAAAEVLLRGYPNFHSIAGSAEATTLPDHSIDFITAGQSFHWFQVKPTRIEFRRILKPGGWVVLLSNSRQIDTTPFSRAYEQLLLTYGTDYEQVRQQNAGEQALTELFGSGGYRTVVFPNFQVFDFEDLKGRLLSSSYAPLPGHPNYEPMIAELRQIFDRYQTDGTVRFEYDTEVFYGQLGV